MDDVDPDIIATAEAGAAETPGVRHAHARARWTGRTLCLEVEGWLDPDITVTEADQIGQLVAARLTTRLPQMRAFTWAARGVRLVTSPERRDTSFEAVAWRGTRPDQRSRRVGPHSLIGPLGVGRRDYQPPHLGRR